MNNKLQKSKCKTKLKICQNMSPFYDDLNYRRHSGTFKFEKNVFSKGGQGSSKNKHEIILII